MAVIQPGVVGRTRSESEDDPLKYGMAAYQAVGDLTARRRALAEQQRQFDINTGIEQFVKPAGGFANLLSTEQGRAVGEPLIAQMLQIKNERPGLLGRFIAEKAPGIAQMLGIEAGEVQSYMTALAEAPLTEEYLRQNARSAVLDGRVVQGGETPPSYMDIAKGVLAGYQGASAATQPSAPVAALADDRTPPPAPPAPPPSIAKPAPSPAASGTSYWGIQGYEGVPRGAATPPLAPDAIAGAAAPGKVEYRVRPDRAMGGTGFVIDEIVDGKVVVSRGVGGKDFMQSGVAPYKTEAEAQAAIAKFGQPSAGAKPLSTGQGGTESAQPGAGGAVAAAVTPASQAAPAQATEAPLRTDMSFREFVRAKQQAGALGGTLVSATGDDTSLRADNAGTFQEYQNFIRSGQAPSWQASTAQPQAQAAVAPAGAGTIASAVSAATSPDKQSLSPDDMMIARWYATTSKNSGMGEAYGLQPLSPAEMKQAEVILAKRQRELAGQVVREWTAAPNQSAYNARVAGRYAGVLQRVGGDLPPELHPYLTDVMTNWAHLKARNEEATIQNIQADTDLKRADAQYTIDRLKVEAAKDQLTALVDSSESAQKLVNDFVTLINGPAYKDRMAEINKLAVDNPRKAGEMFGKLIEGDPVFKSMNTALQRSIAQLTGAPLSVESMPFFYGGWLGMGQSRGSAAIGSVGLVPDRGGLGTDPTGEYASYTYGGQ